MESMTPETVLAFIKSTVLRGGGLVSTLLLFVFCRQISFAMARLSPGNKPSDEQGANALLGFRVDPVLIWVISGSLLLVVLSSMVKLEVPEIILWNILILCGILYFAQGLGILQFFLTRPTVSPFLRLPLSIFFIVLLFSPGINVVLLGGVALLGIAENWVPFRAPKSNGPPSTPEAEGDAGN